MPRICLVPFPSLGALEVLRERAARGRLLVEARREVLEAKALRRRGEKARVGVRAALLRRPGGVGHCSGTVPGGGVIMLNFLYRENTVSPSSLM